MPIIIPNELFKPLFLFMGENLSFLEVKFCQSKPRNCLCINCAISKFLIGVIGQFKESSPPEEVLETT